MEVLVITPVKDSPETTKKTIEAVSQADGNFKYVIFNDFSGPVTRKFLEESQKEYNFDLIHLEDFTQTPSPNYKLILRMAREMALSEDIPLLLIESDVIIQKTTINQLLALLKQFQKPGLIGAITVDIHGNFNFPYAYVKKNNKTWLKTQHSLSFCCTLISQEFLRSYNFSKLPEEKDWFDIYISRQSIKAGFLNYLVTAVRVLHLPHSSRPWKQLKYSNPIKYYFYKLTQHRDRI
jgi:hypothetical protein